MGRSRGNHLRMVNEPAKPHLKVEFPTLGHFIEEVKDAGIEVVRLDPFVVSKPSELSFVYYVTMTVYVTAQLKPGMPLYEYREAVGTATSVDETCDDDLLKALTNSRVDTLIQQLSEAKLEVRHGRYVPMNE